MAENDDYNTYEDDDYECGMEEDYDTGQEQSVQFTGRREQLQGEMTGSGNDGAVVIRSSGNLMNLRGGMPTM